MTRLMAVGVCLACLATVVCAAEPTLRFGPGQPAPPELVAKIMEANSFWLRPPVKALSYRWAMRTQDIFHPDQKREWRGSVQFTAPDKVTVQSQTNAPRTFNADDAPGFTDSLRGTTLTCLLQGVFFFSTLQALRQDPKCAEVRVVDDDRLDGRPVTILQLRPTGRTTPEMMDRWEQMLRGSARHPRFEYQLLPVEEEVGGVKKIAIELRCLREEGPSWEELNALRNAAPRSITWGGYVFTAMMREDRGTQLPMIVFERDPQFRGPSPIRHFGWNGGPGQVATRVTFSEGEEVVDETRLEHLRATVRKPEVRLGVEVGCGVSGTSYQHETPFAQVEQMWVDAQTGLLLREEGFDLGKPTFAVDYSDYQPVPRPGGLQAPGHVVVTILGPAGQLFPLVYDMRFQVPDGTAWVLDKLQVLRAGREFMAGAEVTRAVAEPLPPR